MPSKFHILTVFLSSDSSSLTLLLNICTLFFLPKNSCHLKSPELPISALVTVAVPKIAFLFPNSVTVHFFPRDLLHSSIFLWPFNQSTFTSKVAPIFHLLLQVKIDLPPKQRVVVCFIESDQRVLICLVSAFHCTSRKHSLFFLLEFHQKSPGGTFFPGKKSPGGTLGITSN